jgi:hypothetical protein
MPPHKTSYLAFSFLLSVFPRIHSDMNHRAPFPHNTTSTVEIRIMTSRNRE